MLGSGMAGGGKKVSAVAHQLQSFITRRFDTVSSISHTMCASAERNSVSKNKVILFPNWVDIDFITPDADGSWVREKWGIAAETKVVLYSGNLGKKQGLEIVLESAQEMEHRKDILFIIVGDGAHKTELIRLSKQMELGNIQFHSLQPYKLLPNLLRMADIHLVIQKRGTADAVLPSKLTSILSIGGHSVITAEPDTELGHIVRENPGIATLIPPEKPEALTGAIIALCDNPGVGFGQVNQQARKYAENKLGKDAILSQFERDLLEMVGRGRMKGLRTED